MKTLFFFWLLSKLHVVICLCINFAGNFDVDKHIKAETSNARKAVNQILYGLGLMIVGHGLICCLKMCTII